MDTLQRVAWATRQEADAHLVDLSYHEVRVALSSDPRMRWLPASRKPEERHPSFKYRCTTEYCPARLVFQHLTNQRLRGRFSRRAWKGQERPRPSMDERRAAEIATGPWFLTMEGAHSHAIAQTVAELQEDESVVGGAREGIEGSRESGDSGLPEMEQAEQRHEAEGSAGAGRVKTELEPEPVEVVRPATQKQQQQRETHEGGGQQRAFRTPWGVKWRWDRGVKWRWDRRAPRRRTPMGWGLDGGAFSAHVAVDAEAETDVEDEEDEEDEAEGNREAADVQDGQEGAEAESQVGDEESDDETWKARTPSPWTTPGTIRLSQAEPESARDDIGQQPQDAEAIKGGSSNRPGSHCLKRKTGHMDARRTETQPEPAALPRTKRARLNTVPNEATAAPQPLARAPHIDIDILLALRSLGQSIDALRASMDSRGLTAETTAREVYRPGRRSNSLWSQVAGWASDLFGGG